MAALAGADREPSARGDGIVLIGLPGTGKSAIGRRVAAALGRDFVDTDELVEQRTGLSAAEHNLRGGDAGFRAVERQAIPEACQRPGTVIATGGGAVIEPANRALLWRHGTVVWIRVRSSVLVERLRADPVPRPNLQPYRVERIDELLAAREPFYRAADVWIEGEDDPKRLAAYVVMLLTRPIRVARGEAGTVAPAASSSLSSSLSAISRG